MFITIVSMVGNNGYIDGLVNITPISLWFMVLITIVMGNMWRLIYYEWYY